jgi:hypothetical protein
MNQALGAGEADRPAREGLSAFSGLAVLCILVVIMATTTFISSGGSAQTLHQYASPAPTFRPDIPRVETFTFYLVESEAPPDETRELVEFAAAQEQATQLQSYLKSEILIAGTPDEEAIAYARIVERMRSSRSQQQNIDVVDLRAQKPE